MILTRSGEILTNNHVIEDATSIRVTVVSTGRTYSAAVVGTDPTDDVAVLQLSGASGLPTVPLGDSSAVRVGQAVTAAGNAGGGTPSVVAGAVTAVGQTITARESTGANARQLTDLIETNAPIVPGDSGGPLVTSSGSVIGIDTAASVSSSFQSTDSATSQGYAIPINTALSVARQIEAGRASSTIHLGVRGFLGVEAGSSAVGDGTYGDGTYGDGQPGTAGGAQVLDTVEGSPAAAAGIAAGDVITSVDGQAVDSSSALTAALQSSHPGDRTTVRWTDPSGQTHSATITLARGAAD